MKNCEKTTGRENATTASNTKACNPIEYYDPEVEVELEPYLDIPGVDLNVLLFIYNILHHGITVEAEDAVYNLFARGYCYYLALMLKDAFPGGTIVWCAPYGHIAYRFNNVIYDIHYVYDGECDLFIPIERIGKTIDDFRKIRSQNHATTKAEMRSIIEENQLDPACRGATTVLSALNAENRTK